MLLTLCVPLRVQEASDTAHEAAEAVLKPQTSASYYNEEPDSEAQAQPDEGGGATAHPATDEDRFLSLATGEAQADAPDVGEAPTESSAHNALPSQQQPDPATDPHAAEQGSSAPQGKIEQGRQPASEHAGAHEGGHYAPSALLKNPAAEVAADQAPSLDHLG